MKQEADREVERLSGVKAERFPAWSGATAERNREASLLVDFDAGFVVPGQKPLVVVTASDVLGSRAHHPQPMARAWNAAFDHTDVPELGSVVVHLQRGLGLLDGLQSVATGDVSSRDMIRLVFAGEDAVLVPPADLALIWPYASELGELTLDKADGSTWWARRTEAEQEIQIAGKQLSNYISQRRRRRAPKLAPPGPVYERFVARFPYFTTVDQAKAVRDVLDDLASGHPMDRVICGDVGFGKTEVALRAAAAVVLSGKQVAIAVPTTVLARQHVATFRKRFAPFNIEVGRLSRAASAAETREAKEGLKSGKLKVVVGTQALASKDVKFADLGLIIIDEEQHFGAAEKAKLSELAKGVHALWMSATPISSDSRGRSRGLQGSQCHRLAARSSTSGGHEGRSAFECCYCSGIVARAKAPWAKLLDLSAYSGPRLDVGPSAIGGPGSPHRLSPWQVACRRNRRPNDELRRRRDGRSAGDQHSGEWSRYSACKHDRGLLARKVRPCATPSAQRKGRARWDTCVCVFVDRFRGGAIREAARRSGGVQQTWRGFCHQCAGLGPERSGGPAFGASVWPSEIRRIRSGTTTRG